MIPDFLISILRVALVLTIMLGMIALLLGINHVTRNDDSISPAETRKLRHEVEDEEKVITRGSVFHKFLARDFTRRSAGRR